MHRLTKKFVTVAVTVATIGAVSLAVGLNTLPVGAVTPVGVSFSTGTGVEPSTPTVAGVPFTTTPAVAITGTISTGATVTLSLSGGTAGAVLTCGGSGANGDTFPATATTTFNGCWVNLAGSGYELVATESPDTGSGTSSAFTINAASASQLAFDIEPSSGTTAGSDLDPTIWLEDAFGNHVTTGSSSSDTVELTIASGPGSASLICAPEAMSSGVYSFSCPIDVAGTYTLEASDISNGTIAPGFSLSFTVVPGPDFKLAFINAPALNSTVGLNTNFPVSVAVEDQYGNIITSGIDSGITVDLSLDSNPSAATLTCPTVPTLDLAAFQGIATYPDGCQLNKAGTGYTLEASGVGTPPVSQPFNVGTAVTPPTTVTTTAPTSVTTTTAVLNGNVVTGGAAQTCYFFYGTNPTVTLDPTTGSVSAGSVGTEPVSIGVGSLTPGATYYYALDCNGVQGNTVSFIATPVSGIVVTTTATPVGSTTATLNGTDNPGGVAQSCYYLYGTSSVLSGAAATGSVLTSAVTYAVSVPINVTTLTPSTQYFFELVCTNGSGGILSFTTSSSSGLAVTSTATPVGSTTATLNGTDYPGGVAQSCYYLYGTSSILTGAASTGSVVTSAVSTAVSVPINVTTLTPSTLYYFELVCSNGTGAILSFTTASTGTPLPIQIYGTDAIGTSIAISQAEFPTGNSAGGVVLARDDFFSDALVGGPLAAAINGPLLLTEGAPISATIDARTLAEIQRVLPVGGNVYILGGNLAINPNVDSTLRGLGYTVIREAGADLYATAVDVAETLGNPTTIFEATGTNFYDALSAAPAAIEEHAAILLTNGPTQSLETYAYLVTHPGDTRFAIGGPLAAYGADSGATPVYGQDLFNTSAAVASYFFPNATIFGLATAAEFPDALGGGVFMATGGRLGPLLLVNPSAPLPSEIVPYLNSLPVGAQGYVFGGPLAVGSSVLTAAQAAVG